MIAQSRSAVSSYRDALGHYTRMSKAVHICIMPFGALHIVSSSGNKGLIKSFLFSVHLQMIGCSPQLFISEEGTIRLEELTDKPRSDVRQDARQYTIRYNPVTYQKDTVSNAAVLDVSTALVTFE